MFQCKIDEISKGLLNIFYIAEDILNVGYDAYGKDHDRTIR